MMSLVATRNIMMLLVVFLTGSIGTASAATSLEEGMQDYLWFGAPPLEATYQTNVPPGRDQDDADDAIERERELSSTKAPNYSCNVYADTCPTQFNGVCDRTTNPSQCANGDCFDCDPCRKFQADCEGCVHHGCYWCPGDATCFNSNQYVLLNRLTSCTQPSDYTQSTSCTQAGNVFNDPEYSADAWIYNMVDLQKVWTTMGYQGEGVRVRVNDNGVDVTHPEFQGRVDLNASCNHYLPQIMQPGSSPSSSSSASPAPSAGGTVNDQEVGHGTSVASIVLAAANNSICGVGIAPKATLSSCNVFDSNNQANFLNSAQFSMYDVSQNSFGEDACPAVQLSRRRTTEQEIQEEREWLDQQWRLEDPHRLLQPCPFSYRPPSSCQSNIPFPCDYCASQAFLRNATPSQISSQCQTAIIMHCQAYYNQDRQGCLQFLDLLVAGGECHYTVLPLVIRDGLKGAILDGRDGKGIVFLFAAGNDYTSGGNVNNGGYAMSRFVMSVGAVGKRGLHASYSNTGASLFVSAPGGDHDTMGNFVTAGLRAAGGSLCHDAGVGTSFACPVVSGTVALMLEANPNLTWRDVQEIVALTSKRVVDNNYGHNASAMVNAAGYWHSDYYGFGIIQAHAAVSAAETWVPIGPEEVVVGDSGTINLPIHNNSTTPSSSTIVISNKNNPNITDPNNLNKTFLIENVEVLLDLQDFSRGFLEIILTSPQGTRSTLSPGYRPENTQLAVTQGARWKMLTVRAWGERPEGNWTLTIQDVMPGEVTAHCVDRPWSISQGATLDPVTCVFLEDIGACANGQLNPQGTVSNSDMILLTQQFQDNGYTATQACCACGFQGLKPSQVNDRLNSWTLVAYGRYAEDGGNNTVQRPHYPVAMPATAFATRSPAQPARAPVSMPSLFVPTSGGGGSTPSPTSNPNHPGGPVSGGLFQGGTPYPSPAPTPQQNLGGRLRSIFSSAGPPSTTRPRGMDWVVVLGTSSAMTGLLLWLAAMDY